MIAVGVGKGEGAAEGAVDGGGDDRVAVSCQGVVDGLHVSGVQPDSRSDAGLGNGREVGARCNLPQGERDGGCVEYDGVGRAGLRW